MITIDAKTFFDTRKIQDAAKKAQYKPLGHTGGYVSKVAKRGMRKRKSASTPGSPPSVHTGGIKRAIVYSINREMLHSDVGLNAAMQRSGNTIGALHEFGGYIRNTKKRRTIKTSFSVGDFGPLRKRYGKPVWGRIKSGSQAVRAAEIAREINDNRMASTDRINAMRPMAHYPKRPWLAPALAKSIPWIRQNYPQLMKSSLGTGTL